LPAAPTKKKSIDNSHLPWTLNGGCALLPFFLTFDNRNVAIDGEIGESLLRAARLRPFYFQPIDLGVATKP
jgi:hypothetical protein